jgi:hypothetical protein
LTVFLEFKEEWLDELFVFIVIAVYTSYLVS